MRGLHRSHARSCKFSTNKAPPYWRTAWRHKPMLDVLTSPWTAFQSMRMLGGPVVNGIFAACVLMWAIAIERFWFFRKVLPHEAKRMQHEWMARTNRQSWISHQVRRAMISKLNAGM